MKPKTKKPFITIKESLVAAFVLWFTAVAFEKIEVNQVPTRSVIEAEVRLVTKQIPELPISKVVEKLENSNGKPTLMVLYASWCGYCKKLLPRLYALKKEGRLDNINLLFLSADEDKEALARYILRYSYGELFDPYIIEKGGVTGLASMLYLQGVNYSGSIPYAVMFDGNGKALQQVRRINADKSVLLEEIGKAAAIR